jgi:hypothetical protein
MWPLIIPAITQLLDKLIPDPAAKAQAQLEVMRMQQSGELAELESVKALSLAQLDVDKADASSSDKFTSRWRPLIGYICGACIAWDWVAKPMLLTGWAMSGHPVPALPSLTDTQVYGVLFGMLGLGGYRTIEKVKGAA